MTSMPRMKDSKDKSNAGQTSRIPNSDMVTLGDANLNALKWDEDNFEFKEMAKRVFS